MKSGRAAFPAERHFDLLRVEAFGGNGVHELIETQPVQHGGLAGTVQAENDNVQGLKRRQTGKDGMGLR